MYKDSGHCMAAHQGALRRQRSGGCRRSRCACCQRTSSSSSYTTRTWPACCACCCPSRCAPAALCGPPRPRLSPLILSVQGAAPCCRVVGRGPGSGTRIYSVPGHLVTRSVCVQRSLRRQWGLSAAAAAAAVMCRQTNVVWAAFLCGVRSALHLETQPCVAQTVFQGPARCRALSHESHACT